MSQANAPRGTATLTTLPSGVRVVTESMDSVRSAAVGMWVGVGSRDETPDEAGCSHFLEHLLFKGTSRRSARGIAEELDEVGGELNAFTSKELTCFYARVLDVDLPLAVDVLGDMLANATNTPEDVEAERQVVLEELGIHHDTPDDLVHSDLTELALGDHPLALETLGTVASVEGLDRDTIDGYWRRHYRPENLVVAAVGNVTHDAVTKLVEDHLGDLGRPGGEPPVRVGLPPDPAPSVRVRHRPTEQAHVAFGGRGMSVLDDRRHAMRVLASLLGGGMSSRLFQRIREELGLAYSTYAYASTYLDGGQWAAYAGTMAHRVEQVLEVLRAELDRLPDTITADEVARAKGQLRGNTVLGLEDPSSRMHRLGAITVSRRPIVDVDEALRRLDAVTLDDVRDVAEELWAGSRHLAVVGPFDEAEADRFHDWVTTPTQ